jgi:hypothetical protein
MYPIEWRLGTMKNLLRNRVGPEESIARAYIESEVLTFCSSYMDDDVDGITEFDGPTDGDTSVFMHGVHPVGRDPVQYIDDKTFKQLVWYVLNNSDEVEPYLE